MWWLGRDFDGLVPILAVMRRRGIRAWFCGDRRVPDWWLPWQ